MQQHAFTSRYDRRMRVLYNKVGISLLVTAEAATLLGKDEIKFHEYLAIWDTGATNSCITKKVAEELRLKPTGLVEVRHADGKSKTPTYLVNIALPNRVTVPQIRVTEVKLIPDDNTSDDQQPQVLIGMDIIGVGDFAVTNSNDKTTFSFRIPSVEEIDFVPGAEENNIMEGGNRQARRAFEAKQKRGRY